MFAALNVAASVAMSDDVVVSVELKNVKVFAVASMMSVLGNRENSFIRNDILPTAAKTARAARLRAANGQR